MRDAVHGALIVAACAAVAGCYLAHERDGVAIDGGAPSHPDAAPSDTGRCGLTGDLPPWQGRCTPERSEQCRQLAMMLAPGRVAHATCLNYGRPGEMIESLCTWGDHCPDGPYTGTCRCNAAHYCAAQFDVCVSDTPDGPTYCAPWCS